jgi:hypothetical protein
MTAGNQKRKNMNNEHIHGTALTRDQIIEWCQAWWTSSEWKKQQLQHYACDTAHMLRGIANMIELSEQQDLNAAKIQHSKQKTNLWGRILCYFDIHHWQDKNATTLRCTRCPKIICDWAWKIKRY